MLNPPVPYAVHNYEHRLFVFAQVTVVWCGVLNVIYEGYVSVTLSASLNRS